MSDISYGGTPDFSDYTFSYSTDGTSIEGGGGTPIGGLPPGTSDTYYDFSTLQAFDISTDDFITTAGDDLASIVNPFKERVVVGFTRHYLPGGILDIPKYADNPAYSQFEAAATAAQEKAFPIEYADAMASNHDVAYGTDAAEKEDYDNARFGDINAFYSLIDQISALEYEIGNAASEDALTRDYNRIADTNNGGTIDEKKEELDDLKRKLEEFKNDYENSKREFIRDMMESEKGDWNIIPSYTPVPGPGLDLSRYGYQPSTPSETLNFIQSGEINDWMAGGNLYDSPRAGNQLFNVTGDMNTVRFLGLQDKNYNAHLKRELNGMANLHKMLGVSAGSNGFSVL